MVSVYYPTDIYFRGGHPPRNTFESKRRDHPNMSVVDRARKRVKMQPASAVGAPVQTNLQRLVGVGDAYHDLDAETGLRALWRLALPDDAVS